MLARDVMTRQVVTVGPKTSIREAARLLADLGFTALPVVDEHGELRGIVTEADLLAGRLRHDASSPLLADEMRHDPPPTVVQEVVTTDVFTALPWSDAADLVEQMRARGIRSVPVVEPGHGVVGIVSRRDIVRALARPDDLIAAAVRRDLQRYAGHERWSVSVEEGIVTLVDEYDDPTERHIASVIAQDVPGVVHVKVVSASGEPLPPAN